MVSAATGQQRERRSAALVRSIPKTLIGTEVSKIGAPSNIRTATVDGSRITPRLLLVDIRLAVAEIDR